jgi:hypothetical protein
MIEAVAANKKLSFVGMQVEMPTNVVFGRLPCDFAMSV